MNVAYLKKESPFYDLFEGGAVPIVNIVVPNQALMVDVKRLAPEKRMALAVRIAGRAGARVEEVMDELLNRGLPLRASQVSVVATDVLWFL